MLKAFLAGLVSLMLLAAPVAAQDANPAAAEWQAVVTAQIQAFRDHDAPAALSYAGTSFHTTYADPQQFFLAILAAGYTPIMESRSETFGPYELVTEGVVMQDVKFVGNDQTLYEAIYQLAKEPEGWRVQGVQLIKTPGIGV